MAKQPLRLLMVDDDEEDFLIVRHLLGDAVGDSAAVEHSSTSDDALERVGRNRYDVLLLDYRLGAENGISLLRELKGRHVDVPVIMLTGHGDEEIAVEAMKAGAIEYLNKAKLTDMSLTRAVRYAANLHRKEELLRSAHAQIRANEARYRALFERNLAGVFRSTIGGHILECNEAMVRMHGFDSADEFKRMHSLEGWSPELIERLQTQNHVVNFEFTCRRKDGSPLCLLANLTLLDAANGEPPAVQGTVLDITERRTLEQQLLQAQKMEAVGQLAGGVAHDFNNLLMVISSYSEILLDALTDERQRSHAEQVLKASRRAAALTQQLLAFSRKQVLALRVLDPNAVVTELERILPRLIGEDVHVCVRMGVNVGKIRADPVQIEQVIMNLAANARDAMPRGGTLTIETAQVTLDQEFARRRPPTLPGDYVLLAVSDTGVGIDPAVQARIFEPFFTTKERGKGTGLGLSTVYGIVKQSGGYIWLESEPGRGSTFKIYLPCVSERTGHVIAPPTAPALKPAPAGQETILLVEDEEGVRDSTGEFLRSCGYTVLTATDGQGAVQICRDHPERIDVLVTDVVMPGMGGRELAEALARHRSDMKVLYISGYAEDTVLQRGLVDLSQMFLQKPFTLSSLARKVREVIEGSVAGPEPVPISPVCDTPAGY